MVRDLLKEFDLEKIFWRIVCVLILMVAFNIKVVSLSWEQAEKVLKYKRTQYTQELNDYELDEFIRIYPKFKQDEIFQRVDLDLITKNPETADWVTKRWFIYQAWDIGRFFYVMKRIRKALDMIEIRKEAKSVIEQVETLEDELAQKILQEQQERYDNTDGLTEKELDMIEQKSETFRKLFKG